jgi:hypothetical protein
MAFAPGRHAEHMAVGVVGHLTLLEAQFVRLEQSCATGRPSGIAPIETVSQGSEPSQQGIRLTNSGRFDHPRSCNSVHDHNCQGERGERLLIPSPRTELEGPDIALPAWAAAPLSLGIGVRYWLISERRRSSEGRSSKKELLVTTIPPDVWKDLWRIEIETRDEPGTLAHIHRVLEQLSLRTFVAEGNSNILDASHTMTFVVSAVDHRTAADKGTAERFRNPKSALLEAELTLKLNLLDKLALGMVDEPRLKLRPFSAFKSLHMDCHVKDLRRILDERGHVYGGSIRLPESYLSATSQGKTYYTVVVDTKLRIARLTFFDEAEAYGHIRVSFPSSRSDHVLARVFGLMADNGGNVLRFQLRPAKNGKDRRSQDAIGLEIEHRVYLDITFVSSWLHQTNVALQTKFIELLGRDKELCAGDFRFERTYAEFSDEKATDIQPSGN